ncbi:MAG: ATP-dependent Clp protease ATP-binding subunit, partial [Candidatus Omnitrophica bacterium]|nr:ATP-dependent Clp protease ATP-binding subunit [Candidatus Omnitrophota bacterium]
FRNTVLIMTSNLGAELLKKQGSLGFSPAKAEATFDTMKGQLIDEVKRAFKPEFLNRVDEVIVFRPLTKEDLIKIVELEIGYVRERLREQGMTIELDASAKEFLVEKGFDPVYGARPLKRIIQRFLEDPLAEEIIARRFKPGAPVRVFRKGEGLEFEGELAVGRPAATEHQ